MNSIAINLRPRNEAELSQIMGFLSDYNCDFKLNTTDVRHMIYPYPYSTRETAYTRLGEKIGRSPEEYRKDIRFIEIIGRYLQDFGLSPHHKGFKYAIECIRLMQGYGLDDYSMVNDVYPVISKWYRVSSNSVEHNIRNAINIAWDNCCRADTEDKSDIRFFTRKPTNTKFLRHISALSSSIVGSELLLEF